MYLLHKNMYFIVLTIYNINTVHIVYNIDYVFYNIDYVFYNIDYGLLQGADLSVIWYDLVLD